MVLPGALTEILPQSIRDLGSFCRETVPEFAPLGGGRPDCAVVMGQLVSQYDTGSGCYLPPDVVDTGMAFLCAPVLITSLHRKLDVTSPHDTVVCRLELETSSFARSCLGSPMLGMPPSTPERSSPPGLASTLRERFRSSALWMTVHNCAAPAPASTSLISPLRA